VLLSGQEPPEHPSSLKLGQFLLRCLRPSLAARPFSIVCLPVQVSLPSAQLALQVLLSCDEWGKLLFRRGTLVPFFLDTPFEWGYYGTGPRLLAEAILADFFAEDYPEHGYASQKDYNALLYGFLFKEAIIGKLPRRVDGEEVDDSWEITSDQIKRWFYSLEEQGITKEALLKDIYGEEYYKMN